MQQATTLLHLWSMLENILFATLGVFAFSVMTLMLENRE